MHVFEVGFSHLTLLLWLKWSIESWCGQLNGDCLKNRVLFSFQVVRCGVKANKPTTECLDFRYVVLA